MNENIFCLLEFWNNLVKEIFVDSQKRNCQVFVISLDGAMLRSQERNFIAIAIFNCQYLFEDIYDG